MNQAAPATAVSAWRRSRVLRIDAATPDAARRWLPGLAAEPGIAQLAIEGDRLRISYDLQQIDLARIVALLEDLGIALARSPWQRLRLRLTMESEAIQRADADFDPGWEAVLRDIYLDSYLRRRHGRRDDRPQHWRKSAQAGGGAGSTRA